MEAKRKLEKNTIAISDRLDFLQYLLSLLKSADGTLNSEETRLNYILTLHKAKENLTKLSEYPLSELKVNLKSEIDNSFKKTLEFTKIATLSVARYSRPLPKKLNIITAKLSLVLKYEKRMSKLMGCTVLSSGNMLCVENMNSKRKLITVKIQKSRGLFARGRKVIRMYSAFQVEPNPWEILLDNGVLYISHDNKDTSCILRISADNFKALDLFLWIQVKVALASLSLEMYCLLWRMTESY